MIKRFVCLLIGSFIFMLLLAGCGKENEEPPVIVGGGIMTMTADVDLPVSDELLVSDDSIREIVLTFSEPIDETSIEKGLWVNAFSRGTTEPRKLLPEVTREGEQKNILRVKFSGKEWSEPHTLYQLYVSKALKSLEGAALEKEEGGFFYIASDACFDTALHTADPNPRRAIVVVSDIHMGDQRSLNGGYGWFKDNKKYFEDFLGMLIANAALIDKLVIAGDFMDEWVAPMNQETFADESGNPLSQQEFVGKIIVANQTIVDKLKELRQSGVAIVYTPGNHDMLVTSDDFDRYFGVGVITQARDSRGLGRYEPSRDIVIEHGHRYDYFNSPDPFSNKGIDEVGETSILPPGFFVSKIASSSDMRTKSLKSSDIPFPDLEQLVSGYTGDNRYWAELSIAWPLVLLTKPVTDKSIKTGIDGFTRDYTIKEVSDWSVTGAPEKWRKPLLYSTSYSAQAWTDRLKANGVLNVDKVTFETGLLSGVINSTYVLLADNQYISGLAEPKRIVVFGHTHEAEIRQLGTSVYANSGTWVDKKWAPKMPERTFVIIQDYLDSGKKGSKEISLFSFGGKEAVSKLGKTYHLRYK